MNKLANTKSQLAKLMATENITVQHQNAPTASFDVKNRVLTLPNFEDGLSVNLYDLMTSHEVGHALWTPEDGWHDAVCDKGMVFKGFLNVIEDARIEKKIKAKYPGILKAYRDGYKELLDRNFFGIAGKDISEMAFIDRLNLHFKLGTLVNLKFEGEEAEWVAKIEAADTWEDVLNIASTLYDQQIEQAEEELEEQIEKLMRGALSDKENEDNDTDGNGDNSSDEDEDGDAEYGPAKGDAGEEGEESGFGDYEDDDMGEFEDEDLEDVPMSAEEMIESETDNAFRSNEGKLVKNTGRESEYFIFNNVPSADFVVPFKTVNEKYAEMLAQPSVRSEILAKFSTWRQANTKIVNYMVKEFEMRKKADEFKRASVAKTGELDMTKVFQYKYNDDLFKRVTTVTGGKNHGFVMLLDWSGSMAGNMAATIDQLMNLVMFCKKVKIPFEVYAFSDAFRTEGRKKYNFEDTLPAGTLIPGRDVRLVTLFDSKMKTSEFNNACIGMMGLRECLENGRYYRFNIPSELQLGGTPLDDALLLMPDVLKKFITTNRVQIANLVVLTDGDSHNCDYVCENGYDSGRHASGFYPRYRSDAYVTDAVTKRQYKVEGRTATTTLLEAIGDRCGVNTVGFFIMDNKPREIRGQAARFGVYDQEVVKQIRNTKFLEVKNGGYDSYFLIPGGKDLTTENEGLKVDDGASKAKIRSAFMKSSGAKTANRVLLNRLMEVVA